MLGAKMDIAVVTLGSPGAEKVLSAWNEPTSANPYEAITWPRLSAGADIFVVGYPYGLRQGRFPLWLRGTIATEPSFGYMVDDEVLLLMLVDARNGRAAGNLGRQSSAAYLNGRSSN